MVTGCSHSTTSFNGGIVPVPDSVRNWLTEQSEIIGFYAAVKQDSSYLDTVQLPQWASDRVFEAITALWQSNLKERDTVFDVYALKEYSNIDFHSVLLCEDTDSVKYRDILDQYGFSHDSLFQIRTFRTSKLLNTIAVVRDINERMGYPRYGFPGMPFVCAEPNSYGGSGNSVDATIEPNAILLVYTVRYGDCPGGCISYRAWTFEIRSDYSVTYLGVMGDPPPSPKEAEH